VLSGKPGRFGDVGEFNISQGISPCLKIGHPVICIWMWIQIQMQSIYSDPRKEFFTDT